MGTTIRSNESDATAHANAFMHASCVLSDSADSPVPDTFAGHLPMLATACQSMAKLDADLRRQAAAYAARGHDVKAVHVQLHETDVADAKGVVSV